MPVSSSLAGVHIEQHAAGPQKASMVDQAKNTGFAVKHTLFQTPALFLTNWANSPILLSFDFLIYKMETMPAS